MKRGYLTFNYSRFFPIWWLGFLPFLLVLFFIPPALAATPSLTLPKPGDQTFQILSPTLLELVLVNAKQPNPSRVDRWDWVNDQGTFVPPDLSSLRVRVDGQTNNVMSVGFKRRPIYSTVEPRDLRIGNYLYLQLNSPISSGQSVQVFNDGTLWPTNKQFAAVMDPIRYSPAIHVNQEGYLPAYPKKASVGYYIGNKGEMAIPTNTFSLVKTLSGATVYQGALTLRLDVGYTYTPTPYQKVYEADFSNFTMPGAYLLVVPGMGASLPFRIDEGIGMNFARTFALGVFHQRSGYNVAMPFTRFTHAADHTTPASVPTNASAPFAFTWATITDYATQRNPDNPPQIPPLLTNASAQLYPFVNQRTVSVSGGHFEAGDYNRVTYNAAQLIHSLMFAVDSLPGVATLDNLGLPESGDGISDVMQEAKWEADFLAKMQDADGGFYYSAYPQFREYESDVLPENGDPEVVWPKNTVSTAVGVAALAQCASSPRFKQAYPQAASNYWAKAQLGWKFLTNAAAIHGLNSAYQTIQHFGDDFTDVDERAWAACEMYLATGDPQYHTLLKNWFPDPTDPATAHWSWWRMYACYGNAIRDYSMAARNGRLQASQLDASYWTKCVNAITNCGNDNLTWSQKNSYGSSFPESTKAYRGGSWYFSSVQSFDMVVAYQFNPNPAYIDAILRNLNYEAGSNPLNQPYVTGVGWKRQRNIVDQYSSNDRHLLPKSGIPVSNIQSEFQRTWQYGTELRALPYPSDYATTAPYPFYDRWCDDWNIATEGSTTDTARSLAGIAWLAAQTSMSGQPWSSTNASIVVPTNPKQLGQPVTVTLQVAETNLNGARIVWEARDQEPSFGTMNYTFTPLLHDGPHWVEAEVQWPDGRRAFAVSSVTVSTNAPPQLSDPQRIGTNGFSFLLGGVPQALYFIQVSTNLVNWTTMGTNQVPVNGVLRITDTNAAAFSRHYFRALKVP
ncbi:MAG: glycoside hydrolase family 9 protein [Verrucomicrobiota bacterium]